MQIDHNVREELIKRYASGGILRRNFRCRMKIMLWESTIKFAYGVKRSVDILGATVGVILLSPVFIITSILIYIDDPGPVFFSQNRVGKNGRHFKFFKFRSMYLNAEERKRELIEKNESKDGVIFKMKDDPRITKIGKFIRKYSIDELPQLFNVMLGDMSLVGPRPAVPAEVAQYTLEERKRLSVTPGITGIWQISGRSDIPFKQQVKLDMQYIHSQSLWQDIKILIKTIPAVITGKGAY